jgi:polyhydroxyalkanoate synthase subunit PhaC
MAGELEDRVQATIVPNVPGPDVMLGVWASWMDKISASTQVLAGPSRSWWEIATANPAAGMLSGGTKQFQGHRQVNR